MDWYHKTSYEWLDARRKYITASDIPKLMGTTATGRPKSPASVEEALRGVWATKQCAARMEDCESRGVMARGHLLERFAIADLNETEYITGYDYTIHHWDDAIVHSADGVSCSPDGLSVAQPPDLIEIQGVEIKPVAMVEVKAYNGTSHYESGINVPKMQLPERWQIATAFYVMPTLVRGLLVFYNPAAKHKMFVRPFTRVELEKELETIETLARDYWTIADVLDSNAEAVFSGMGSPKCMTEDDICEILIDERSCDEGLNP